MSDPRFLRLAGAAAIVGGAALATHALLHQLLVGPQADLATAGLTTTWSALAALELAGLAALLLGLAGIHAAQAARAGVAGAVAWVLSTCGALLLAGFVYGNLFLVPAIAEGAPGLLRGEPPARIGLGMLFAFVPLVLGLLVLGVATARARVLPRAAGIVLAVGAVLNVVPVVGFLGIVLVGGAVAWLGASLWRRTPIAGPTTRAAVDA